MKNLIPRKRSLAGRSTRPAVFAAALVVAVAAAAGLATQANAAQAVKANAQARPADDQGHKGERQDHASPADRRSSHPRA